jgi:putative flippase GtrA
MADIQSSWAWALRTYLLHRLEPWLSRVPIERRRTAVQLVQFGIIGTTGFLWYTAVEYAAAPVVGPYVGGLIGFVIAATSNWLLNRYWTFRHQPRRSPHRQWLMFLAANSVGSAVNLGINFSLIATVPFCHAHLVVPIMIGTLFGMFFNFSASRRLVFR